MYPQPTHSPLSARIGCYTQVNPKEIVRLEAERNYTRIYQSNGKHFVVARTLKLVEDDLEKYAPLLRINRKDVINLDYAQGFSLNGDVTLANKTLVSISRRRFKVTMDLLKRHFYSPSSCV